MVKTTIALVELYTHHEVLASLVKLLWSPEIRLKVFTNMEVAHTLRDSVDDLNDLSDIHLREVDESIPSFINKWEIKIQNCDAIVFTSLLSDFRFFSRRSWRPPCYIIVHNLNAFLFPLQNLYFSTNSLPKDLGRAMLLVFHIRYRRRVMNRAHRLFFLSEHLKRYAITRSPLGQADRYRAFSISYYEKTPHSRRLSSQVRIAIPGAVRKTGKDYDSVLRAFRQIQCSRPIELVLLGKAYGPFGRRVIREFQALDRPGLQITCFGDQVPQTQYSRYLSTADFLIIPLKKYRKVGVFKEIYGHSNISGTINDLIRYGVPAMLSDHYPLDPEVENMVARYRNSEDLAVLLKEWIDQSTYSEKKKKAQEWLSKYELTKVGIRLKELLMVSG